jgi:hypothetical protein
MNFMFNNGEYLSSGVESMDWEAFGESRAWGNVSLHERDSDHCDTVAHMSLSPVTTTISHSIVSPAQAEPSLPPVGLPHSH